MCFLIAIQNLEAKYSDVILNTSNLLEYIHHLKQERNLAPSTIVDKLRNLCLVIEYLLTEENATIEDSQLNSKCEITLRWLEKRAKVLRKGVKLQQISNALRGEQELEDADDPKEFWGNPKIKEKIVSIMQTAATGDIDKNDYRMVLAYLSSIIIFRNVQRPAVVENMTIDEFERRKDKGKGKFVIRVFKHKTSATGPANVVISKHYKAMMCQYYELVRSKVTPKSKELSRRFFLTASGNAFRKVTETIKMVAKANGISVPTASLHKKVIATTAHCDDELTEGNIRSLSKHMSHSIATSKKFYQLPGAEKAVDAYETIKRLSKKRYFNSKEDAILLKEWPIEKTLTPTLDLCRRMITRYNRLQNNYRTDG